MLIRLTPWSEPMRPLNTATLLLLLASSVVPAAVSAQQPNTVPNVNQSQTQNPPVQPERTPQQSDQARKEENRSAEDTRINRDWTTRRRGDDRMGMDYMRQRQMDRDEDRRTVGRNWRLDDDDMMDGRARYGNREMGRRIKTCIEYENGDEFCRYRD